MVRTFLKVYMELGSYFLFLQEQVKDIIITGEAGHTGSKRPGLGHADLANMLMQTLVPRQLLGGTRNGRCHGLLEELALAFDMGTHERLGSGAGTGVGGEGQRCLYTEMPAELVKKVVEHCGLRAEELGEDVVWLMGGRRTRGGAYGISLE
jgi:hypothetical protein